MMTRTRRERGFTLVELMITLAILGILAGLAAARVSGGADLDQVANQTSNSLRESSRMAAAAGPVSEQVLAAGETVQVRLHLWGDAGANEQYLAIEKFEDLGTGFTWHVVNKQSIPGDLRIVGYRDSADIDPGSVPQVGLAITDQLAIDCNPHGACAASTLYLEDTKGTQMKVVTMPLHGAPQVVKGW